MKRTIPTKQVLERQKIVELVRKWADVNTEGLLDEACSVFSIPEVEGFIGYKIESSNAVVCGDPVCSPANKPILAKAFDAECLKLNLGAVYTVVSKEFANWAAENLSAIAIEFGTKFVLDPHNNPINKTGSKAAIIRNRVKHALKEGVVIKEYLGNDPTIEERMEAVAKEWLQKRQGPQIYLSSVTLFNDRYGKRWFYGQKDDKIVGLLLLNKLQAQQGWLLSNGMMISDAPKGLSELLIISTLETLDKEKCRFVVMGPAPSKDLGKIVGLGKVRSAVISWVFKISKVIFKLDGRATFWRKFRPQCESSFVLFPHKNLRFSSIKALMQALNVSKG